MALNFRFARYSFNKPSLGPPTLYQLRKQCLILSHNRRHLVRATDRTAISSLKESIAVIVTVVGIIGWLFIASRNLPDNQTIGWDPVSLRSPLLVILAGTFMLGFAWEYRRARRLRYGLLSAPVFSLRSFYL
jgi:hypothetical protein